MSSATVDRKAAHLNICQTTDVSSDGSAGWDSIQLPHHAAPELDFDAVSLTTKFLGQTYECPFLISSMTGGSPEGEALNAQLARFAEARGLPMGVGSQRVALENRSADFFSLRKVAPKARLFANLGLVQMNYGVSVDDCAWLVEKLEAQALILHLNPLQEAIQREGDRNFSNLLKRIGEIKKRVSVPVILKETGCGLDATTCRRAKNEGVDALDIAGLGGTHWGFIEGLRDEKRRALGEMFRSWGIPTVQALAEAREAVGDELPIIASGGLRHGLDAAKALFMGANFVGMAMPFLKKASEGEKALHDFLDLQKEALRIALFCCGMRDVEDKSL